MLKGIGKLLKAGVAVGKPFAVEAAENVVPGDDLGLDIGRAVLTRFHSWKWKSPSRSSN